MLLGLKSKVNQILIVEYLLNIMDILGVCVQEIMELIFCLINNSSNILKSKVRKSLLGVIRMKKICNIVVVLSLLPIITPMKINKIWKNGYFNLKRGYHENIRIDIIKGFPGTP